MRSETEPLGVSPHPDAIPYVPGDGDRVGSQLCARKPPNIQRWKEFLGGNRSVHIVQEQLSVLIQRKAASFTIQNIPFFLLLAVVLISYLPTICAAPGAVRRYSDSEGTALVSRSFRVREIICLFSCQCDMVEFIAC